MFFPTAHVHRLIVSASLAFIVVLSTASGQIANVYELAFVRDSQVFLVRSDGTGLVQLTSDGVNSEPTWAPDGARIAFVRNQGGTDIYVMNADGSNVVRRTFDGRSSSPAWSPDGTRIAFSSLRDGHFGIYVMRVDEDWWNPAHLGFDRGYNAYPAWSPDGSRIAFVSDSRAYDFLYDLYLMNADGSDVRLLLSGPFFWAEGLTYYFQPAWSPDGGTIALTRCGWSFLGDCPESTVALVNADGSGLRSIAGAGGFARPSWSPDGMSIAFGSSACLECPSAIHYVTRDGSESGVLIWDAHSPAWRPYAGLSEDSPQEYSVTLAPASVPTGGTLTIGWSAPAGRPATDWVGLFSPSDTIEVWWVYTGGTTSGTVSLQAPSTSGPYEARYLLEDGYFAAATSPPVTVGSGQPPSLPPANYGVALTPSSVAPGGQLTIAWTAPGGRPSSDWVGLFVPGAQSEIWWTYTGGASSGSATLSAPGAGTYEARYLLEDGYFAAATSPPVTVGSGQPPSLPPAKYGVTLTPSSVAAGDQLTIAWTAPGGRPSTDWVGLFVPGAQYEIWWTYTGGASSGSATLSAPGAGTYEARYLLEDGYQSTATSAPVTVGSSLPLAATSAAFSGRVGPARASS